MKKTRYLHLIIPVFFFCGGVFIYSSGIHAPFYLDDFRRIVDNPAIRDLSIILEPWRHRYTTYVTFALNYFIGGMNPVLFRMVNLIIHTANAVLLFTMLRQMMMVVNNDSEDEHIFIPLLASILFLVHPVQTGAVTYIVQRFASLATMFYLLAVYSYLRWRLKEGRVFSFWYLTALGATLLGMRAKEIVFTLPVMLAVVEYLFFSGPWRRRLLNLLPFLLTMMIIPIEFMSRHSGETNLLSTITRATTVMSEGITIPRNVYFFTEMRVIVTYLRLLFYPENQVFLYNYPQYDSLFMPEVYLSLSLHILLLCSSVGTLLIMRKRQRLSYLVLLPFGILWFYLTISVESSFIPIPHLIFEHRLYLPSAGFFTAVSAGLYLLYRQRWLRHLVTTMAVTAIIVLSVLTYRRNTIWADEVLFWKDNVRKAMNTIAPHYYLARAYAKRGLYRKAIDEYNLAALLGPTYPEIHLAMAETYEKMGYLADARREYKKVIEMRSDDYRGYLGLGRVSIALGDLDSARENLRTAGILNPYDREVMTLLNKLEKRIWRK